MLPKGYHPRNLHDRRWVLLELQERIAIRLQLLESTTSITINGESIDAGSKDFNYKSITIYNSADWAKQDCIDNFKNCPLACWKDPDNHLKDPGEIANPPGVIPRLNYERI